MKLPQIWRVTAFLWRNKEHHLRLTVTKNPEKCQHLHAQSSFKIKHCWYLRWASRCRNGNLHVVEEFPPKIKTKNHILIMHSGDKFVNIHTNTQHLLFLQFASSDPSAQSLRPLHCLLPRMQFPSSHLNWSDPQVRTAAKDTNMSCTCADMGYSLNTKHLWIFSEPFKIHSSVQNN